MVDGESSGVNGATLEILDNSATVPSPLENFASNEMWTSFRDIPNSWLESGELTGSAGGYLKQQQYETSGVLRLSEPSRFVFPFLHRPGECAGR